MNTLISQHEQLHTKAPQCVGKPSCIWFSQRESPGRCLYNVHKQNSHSQMHANRASRDIPFLQGESLGGFWTGRYREMTIPSHYLQNAYSKTDLTEGLVATKWKYISSWEKHTTLISTNKCHPVMIWMTAKHPSTISKCRQLTHTLHPPKNSHWNPNKLMLCVDLSPFTKKR